jgi:very-short-patch-repair endonuclease
MSTLARFKKKSFARRRTDTDAEQALWVNLYRIPIEGTHFRRQIEIGPYRVDFGSLRLKLLIEVDGAIHDDAASRLRDTNRTIWLENEGYRVIRFSNREVTTNMNSVLYVIGLAIESQRIALGYHVDQHPTPALARRPSPSRGG